MVILEINLALIGAVAIVAALGPIALYRGERSRLLRGAISLFGFSGFLSGLTLHLMLWMSTETQELSEGPLRVFTDVSLVLFVFATQLLLFWYVLSTKRTSTQRIVKQLPDDVTE